MTTLTLDRALGRLAGSMQRATSNAAALSRVESDPRELSIAGDPAAGYNERTFHHFLTLEQKRSLRSNRSFLLLLAHLRPFGTIDQSVANRLFSALSLRETDFVGWYREGQVAGAVLIQQSERIPTEAVRAIVDRSREGFRDLPLAVAERLKVRAFQIPLRIR